MNGLYHIGILVSDIDAAIEQYSKIYGVSFRAPIDVTACRVVQRNGSDAPFTCRLSYSTRGPMYVELVEAQGDGLWSVANIGGIHHVGMWSADPKAQAEKLVADGSTWEASMYLDAETIGIVFVRHQGALIEVVTDKLRAPLLEWMEGRAAHVMR
jgi:hypothetical protein